MRDGVEERWSELIGRVFQAERSSLPHRRYPAGRLQRQSSAGEPLYETAFNYNHFHVYQALAQRPELEVSQPQIFEYTNFVLMTNFDLDPSTGVLGLRLNYDSGQVSAAQASALAGYYRRCLEALVSSPESGVETADLLGAERSQVVTAFNATATAYPASPRLQEPFEAQAGRTPDAIAVQYGEQSWSYGELDERSNQLAHWLRARGWVRTRWWGCWRSVRWS